MQFRLLTLFKIMTAIGVAIPFILWSVAEISRVQGPPLVVCGRFLVVWMPIVAGVFLFLHWGIRGKPNDPWITYGLIAGVVVGVISGNVTNLGQWAIDHFNPDLSPRDFRATFGMIVGSICGAWFGALAGGIASMIYRRRTTP